ncbi:uncharacterized protein LOC125104735 [Lutra lutra]|uniref:uncharacterized protein LOC125104735 n=1 Tax=Lutra lutra TaxID=9657 RepID=UPI001FD592F0|nr:uncharacterized protein LOC125104735 [Lutra lutra]
MRSCWRLQCGQLPDEELNKSDSKHSLESHHPANYGSQVSERRMAAAKFYKFPPSQWGLPSRRVPQASGLRQSRGWEQGDRGSLPGVGPAAPSCSLLSFPGTTPWTAVRLLPSSRDHCGFKSSGGARGFGEGGSGVPDSVPRCIQSVRDPNWESGPVLPTVATIKRPARSVPHVIKLLKGPWLGEIFFHHPVCCVCAKLWG